MFPIKTSIQFRAVPLVVLVLIAINIAVFVLQQSGAPGEAWRFLHEFALTPARFLRPEGYPGVLMTLLTSAFMHGGFWHLTINMWVLWLFGAPLAAGMGAGRFLAFYLVCGVLASLTHVAINLDSVVPMLGASGAIGGVLGGFSRRYPRARITFFVLLIIFPLFFTLPALIFAGGWFAIQLVGALADAGISAVAGGGIAWWAHIGGFIAGLLLVDLFGERRMTTRERADGRPRILEFGPQRRTVREISLTLPHRHPRHGAPPDTTLNTAATPKPPPRRTTTSRVPEIVTRRRGPWEM